MRPSRILAVAVLWLGTVLRPAAAQAPPRTRPPAKARAVDGAAGDRHVSADSTLPTRLPAQIVADLHSVFGAHGARAVHTKGIILRGRFTPDHDARTLTRAAVFTAEVPIVVRFSDFTGLPDIPDTSYDASPRGFAVKFLMPDGSDLDIVAHSFNGFMVRSSADFSRFLRALAASAPGAAKPTALDSFLVTHPETKHFLTTQKPPPVSYATTPYFGVNAFRFTNHAGQGHYVRYRFVPEAGEHYLDKASVAGKSPSYLMEEIARRVAERPVRFTWYAQLAEPGDPIEDPASAWPEGRRLVRLGVLTIDRVGPNSATADRALAFLPGSLLPGIEIADPMVTIRNASYPVSTAERRVP